MGNSKGLFIERLFAKHGRTLQAYISRRIRNKADAQDLAQEVYVRMLRVTDTEAIRNPQFYLYTVASNLVKERALLDQRQASQLDIDEASVQQQLGQLPPLDDQLEVTQQAARLRAVVEQLPIKYGTALILQHRYGLTYQQIADCMGVSPSMVKKYLAQALGHCRSHMARWE
jgi:RNA polymerase sigma factor (sigma-70 family)